ncbi:MAG: hypothetical protein WC768_02820 [Patescibacteria group bacterium]|jgi:hypothetical protein
MDYRRHYVKRFFGHAVSIPFIWLPFLVLIVLDLCAEIYHQVCFPIYNIPKVKRSEYILIFDRNKLQYLNWFEKINCMYCGYVNGLLAYQKEIAGRTEKYWCGVRHENKPGFKPQPHQIDQNFAQFGDGDDFKKKYIKL